MGEAPCRPQVAYFGALKCKGTGRIAPPHMGSLAGRTGANPLNCNISRQRRWRCPIAEESARLMRVCFVGPLPIPGGTTSGQAVASQVLLEALRAEGHAVDLVDLAKQTYRQGVSSSSRIAQVLRIAMKVWRFARLADVIYITVAESRAGAARDLLLYAMSAPRLKRVVIHLHGGAGMRGILHGRRGVLRRLNEYFLPRLGGVVVLGERLVDIYSHIVRADRIHIVPNFADDRWFAAPNNIDRKFRNVKCLRILFLSNLLPGKGHEELVEALGSLDAMTRSRIAVDFAGGFESDEDERAFRRRIAGLPEARYHGSVHGDAKARLLEGAHVFCLPTYYPYEGQPISILEAYAAGCAVVTTDHSGIFDTFSPTVNGLEVEKRSAASLAEALRRAVDAPEDLAEMARRNLVQATHNYRASHYTKRMLSLIHFVGSASHSADVD